MTSKSAATLGPWLIAFGLACGHNNAASKGRGCIDHPPPKSSANVAGIVPGGNEGCPNQWGACVEMATLKQIDRALADQQRYAQDAWLLCGAPTAEPTSDQSEPPTTSSSQDAGAADASTSLVP